ncbi:MAG: BCCT family transporter, partial [Burkholderiaceae bacterium]|nr:BCCT family transporter [Burkholderiaceae bacterium]
RLGGDDEEPEFSNLSWSAMLFAAGMGIGLVFWGAAEPLSHFRSPPPGVTPMSAGAASAAMRYSFFHWGLHPWAIYTLVALAIAFFQARGGGLNFSSTMGGLNVNPKSRWLDLIDLFAVVATAFGVATSLGLGAMQINSGLNAVFGVTISITAQVVIIVVTTVMFMASALSGLERGVKWLSTINLCIAGLLATAVFIVGPTGAILDTFTDALGGYLDAFVSMSLRLTPFRESSWVGDWTIFYWAWWLSWSPFVGHFIARVSKGRTIREFVSGTLLVPALMCFAWFSVFGGSALHLEFFGHVPLSEAAKLDPSIAIFRLFDALPASALLSGVATLLVMVFFVTSADSATLVLAMLSSHGNANPSLRLKAVWGSLLALVAISLLLAGGLKAIQTAAIVAALPFSFVIMLLCVSLYRAAKKEWREREHAQRELRRRMRDQATQASQTSQSSRPE